MVLTIDNKTDLQRFQDYKRSKMVVSNLDARNETIEIDNTNGDCEVRINFGDNYNWNGSMADLNKILKLAELAKELTHAVKFGNETDSIIERMMNLQNV